MKAWQHRLDVGDLFHNDDLSFREQRDEIVRRITASKWYDPEDQELFDIVAMLAGSDDEEEFNAYWNDLYDWADRDKRLWIDTFGA